MAHIVVGLIALGMLSMIFAWPSWTAVLLVIPMLLSVAIVRYRTVAELDQVTVRTMLRSRTVPWDDIDGLRFGKQPWARARRSDGSELVLPAVTFSTLPLLTAASGGRVPNPYV
jgi:hypothetical protein